MKNQKYTVTAALPYANGPLHLGHIAGVYLPADIFVRFLKLKNKDVVFVSGSDEHGFAITLRAKKEGVSPKEIIDRYHTINKNTFEKFDINFDIYHRTSSKTHHKTAQEYFKKLYDNNIFTEKTSEQYFDEEHKQFLADRYISGECPKCKAQNAYGDQCESCGSTLSPNELIYPKSTISGNSPILKKTSHWYLPLEKYENFIKKWIETGIVKGVSKHNPKEWKNQVIGQCLSWINAGLRPRAMTRDLDWGIKVPLKNAEGKVLYVWFDAPIGYISATKKWAEENNKNWKEYWTNDTKLIHFIGKDNIVFHTIIFPILLNLSNEYVLPNNVPAYEFLNLEGDKFSTSKNWAVWLHEYINEHPDKIDELKYVLTAIAPENKDSEFTWLEFQNRINNELADVLGNFINRGLVLTHKYYNGKVPSITQITDEDQNILTKIKEVPQKIENLILNYKLKEAQNTAINLARIGNKYLADNEPWKLIKTNPKRVQTIMNISLQIIANLSTILKPFLPKKSKEIADFLNCNLSWEDCYNTNNLKDEHQINKPSILFKKIDDEFVKKEVEKLKSRKTINP